MLLRILVEPRAGAADGPDAAGGGVGGGGGGGGDDDDDEAATALAGSTRLGRRLRGAAASWDIMADATGITFSKRRWRRRRSPFTLSSHRCLNPSQSSHGGGNSGEEAGGEGGDSQLVQCVQHPAATLAAQAPCALQRRGADEGHARRPHRFVPLHARANRLGVLSHLGACAWNGVDEERAVKAACDALEASRRQLRRHR